MRQPHAGFRQLEIRPPDAGQRPAAPRPRRCAACLRQVTFKRISFFGILSCPVPAVRSLVRVWQVFCLLLLSQDPAAVRRPGRSLQGVQLPEGASRRADRQVRRRGGFRGRRALREEARVGPRWTPTPGVAARRRGAAGCRGSTAREEEQGGGSENQETCSSAEALTRDTWMFTRVHILGQVTTLRLCCLAVGLFTSHYVNKFMLLWKTSLSELFCLALCQPSGFQQQLDFKWDCCNDQICWFLSPSFRTQPENYRRYESRQ